MKEINVTIGQWYVVEGAAGDTITNPSTGRAIATVEEGKQASFYATTAVVVASSDSVQVYRANFKFAPAALLGLLGGGVSTGGGSDLPSGYLAADFLKNTVGQYIMTGIIQSVEANTGAAIDSQVLSGSHQPLGAGNENVSLFLPFRLKNASWAPLNVGYGWRSWVHGFSVNFVPQSRRTQSELNFYGSGETVAFVDGSEFYRATLSLPYPDSQMEMALFAANKNGGIVLCPSIIYSAQITQGETLVRDFIPALDPHGFPCMYDKATKQPFYNSGTGSFIAGFTIPQARKLGKLPATGGTLTISLPSNWQEDEGVVNALATAEANGWVLTYQTYEAAASTASTFALRRIFVRKTQDENGQYIDADGTRWLVEWCAGMIGAEPTDHGYEPFRSVDAAVAYWELEPWVDPNAEELLTNSTTNEHE